MNRREIQSTGQEKMSEMRCVRMSKNVANDEVPLVAATNSSPVVRRRVKTAPQRTKATHPRRHFSLSVYCILMRWMTYTAITLDGVT